MSCGVVSPPWSAFSGLRVAKVIWRGLSGWVEAHVASTQSCHASGWPPPELDRERCLETLAANLRAAAQAFEPLGVRVLTEAVNSRDRPGYFLTNSNQALAAIERAGHANLAIEHDLYHMQIMEGDLIAGLQRLGPRIGHIQFADNPGRHQPDTGEINFPAVFAAIDESGYEGFVGAEYDPLGDSEASLAWFAPYR